ncbi:hypothetical protein CAC42_790 [Sphaceloma murrayae]|uniref:Apple domain-containing protein n=1 Tax=Sphaceloma murrayae TaxID=2082308 RepID=A0A2K1QKQ3_9PEZI|nr:hypothetical protein CAC42_790 [Sphaceloma murrayae]
MVPSVRGCALLALVGLTALEVSAAPNPRYRHVKRHSSGKSQHSTGTYDPDMYYTTQWVRTITRTKTLMRHNGTTVVTETSISSGSVSPTDLPTSSGTHVTSVHVRSSKKSKKRSSSSTAKSGSAGGNKPSTFQITKGGSSISSTKPPQSSQTGPIKSSTSSKSLSTASEPIMGSTASTSKESSSATSNPSRKSSGGSGTPRSSSAIASGQSPSKPVVQVPSHTVSSQSKSSGVSSASLSKASSSDGQSKSATKDSISKTSSTAKSPGGGVSTGKWSSKVSVTDTTSTETRSPVKSSTNGGSSKSSTKASSSRTTISEGQTDRTSSISIRGTSSGSVRSSSTTSLFDTPSRPVVQPGSSRPVQSSAPTIGQTSTPGSRAGGILSTTISDSSPKPSPITEGSSLSFAGKPSPPAFLPGSTSAETTSAGMSDTTSLSTASSASMSTYTVMSSSLSKTGPPSASSSGSGGSPQRSSVSSGSSYSKSGNHRTSKTPIVVSPVISTSALAAPSFSPKSVSCPTDDGSIYEATNGRDYVVECGIDHAGGNIGMAYVGSFQECLERCAINAQCVSVALSGVACYLKGNVGAVNQNSVWGAKEVGAVEASSIQNKPTTSPASSTAQPSSTSSTGGMRSCNTIANSGPMYTDAASGRTYTVACGSDIAGQGDFAAKYSQSFEGCFAYCASETSCTAFAYFGGICYLKSLKGQDLNINTPSGADIAYMGNAASSTPTSTPGSSCRSLPAEYQSATDRKYKVRCGYDELGFSDIGNTVSKTFSACFGLCDKFDKCVGFAYAAQICYFKGAIGHIKENYNVDLAYLNDITPGEQTSSKSRKPSKTRSPTASASAGPSSCAALQLGKSPVYQKDDGPKYQLYCSVDLYGGDYDTAYSPTYEGCLDICTKAEPCIAFAYRKDSQLCYLKDEVNEGREHRGVDSASIVGLKPNIKPASSMGKSSTMFSTTVDSGSTSLASSGRFESSTGASSTGAWSTGASSTGLASSSSSSTGTSSKENDPSGLPSSSSSMTSSSLSSSSSSITNSGSVTTGGSMAAGSPPTSIRTSSPATSTASPEARGCSDLGPTYKNGSGPEYNVLCNTDYSDGDYRTARSDTFEGCFALCTADPECLAFSYHESSDVCYLKNKILETYGHAKVNSGSVKGGKKPSSSSELSSASESTSRSAQVTSFYTTPPSSTVIDGSTSSESSNQASISTTSSSRVSSPSTSASAGSSSGSTGQEYPSSMASSPSSTTSSDLSTSRSAGNGASSRSVSTIEGVSITSAQSYTMSSIVSLSASSGSVSLTSSSSAGQATAGTQNPSSSSITSVESSEASSSSASQSSGSGSSSSGTLSAQQPSISMTSSSLISLKTSSSTTTTKADETSSSTTSSIQPGGTKVDTPSSCQRLRAKDNPYDDPNDDSEVEYKLRCDSSIAGTIYYSIIQLETFEQCLKACTIDFRCNAFTWGGMEATSCMLYDGLTFDTAPSDTDDSGFVVGEREPETSTTQGPSTTISSGVPITVSPSSANFGLTSSSGSSEPSSMSNESASSPKTTNASSMSSTVTTSHSSIDVSSSSPTTQSSVQPSAQSSTNQSHTKSVEGNSPISTSTSSGTRSTSTSSPSSSVSRPGSVSGVSSSKYISQTSSSASASPEGTRTSSGKSTLSKKTTSSGRTSSLASSSTKATSSRMSTGQSSTSTDVGMSSNQPTSGLLLVLETIVIYWIILWQPFIVLEKFIKISDRSRAIWKYYIWFFKSVRWIVAFKHAEYIRFHSSWNIDCLEYWQRYPIVKDLNYYDYLFTTRSFCGRQLRHSRQHVFGHSVLSVCNPICRNLRGSRLGRRWSIPEG